MNVTTRGVALVKRQRQKKRGPAKAGAAHKGIRRTQVHQQITKWKKEEVHVDLG